MNDIEYTETSEKSILVVRAARTVWLTTTWMYVDSRELSPDQETTGKFKILNPGESKFGLEWLSSNGSYPPVTAPSLVRLTNVDGKLVRTFLFRPRKRA